MTSLVFVGELEISLLFILSALFRSPIHWIFLQFSQTNFHPHSLNRHQAFFSIALSYSMCLPPSKELRWIFQENSPPPSLNPSHRAFQQPKHINWFPSRRHRRREDGFPPPFPNHPKQILTRLKGTQQRLHHQHKLRFYWNFSSSLVNFQSRNCFRICLGLVGARVWCLHNTLPPWSPTHILLVVDHVMLRVYVCVCVCVWQCMQLIIPEDTSLCHVPCLCWYRTDVRWTGNMMWSEGFTLLALVVTSWKGSWCPVEGIVTEIHNGMVAKDFDGFATKIDGGWKLIVINHSDRTLPVHNMDFEDPEYLIFHLRYEIKSVTKELKIHLQSPCILIALQIFVKEHLHSLLLFTFFCWYSSAEWLWYLHDFYFH